MSLSQVSSDGSFSLSLCVRNTACTAVSLIKIASLPVPVQVSWLLKIVAFCLFIFKELKIFSPRHHLSHVHS